MICEWTAQSLGHLLDRDPSEFTSSRIGLGQDFNALESRLVETKEHLADIRGDNGIPRGVLQDQAATDGMFYVLAQKDSMEIVSNPQIRAFLEQLDEIRNAYGGEENFSFTVVGDREGSHYFNGWDRDAWSGGSLGDSSSLAMFVKAKGDAADPYDASMFLEYVASVLSPETAKDEMYTSHYFRGLQVPNKKGMHVRASNQVIGHSRNYGENLFIIMTVCNDEKPNDVTGVIVDPADMMSVLTMGATKGSEIKFFYGKGGDPGEVHRVHNSILTDLYALKDE